MYYLVIYDIADVKRLRHVAKIMQDFGVRVQKSKFEMELTHSTLKGLQSRIDAVINHSEDGVKYFPLCQKCQVRIEKIGQGNYIDPDREYAII